MLIQRRPDLIVGREAEQQQLRDLLDRAIAGHGSLALVSGEAGIGKTTLVNDLIDQAVDRGALVLTGHCYDLTMTPPYGPWSDILRHYRPSGDLPPLPEALADEDRLHELGSQQALFREAAGFFASLASAQPTLLALEDLHWSDPASIELLRYLARELTGQPVLIIASYRDDEVLSEHPLYQQLPSLVRESVVVRIDLQRPGEEFNHELISARYDLEATDQQRLVAYLQQTAEGNPLFTTEVLRSLEMEKLLTPGPDRWDLSALEAVSVPALIRQIIDRRLLRLEEATISLLRVAAVIGQRVPYELWQSVSGADDEELAAAIEAALSAHILVDRPGTDRLSFSHALIRQALYESLVLPRRRAWHRNVAEALADMANADPDEVAFHFNQAGDARAVAWLIQAAVRAERRYSWPMAAERFEAALPYLDSPDQAAQRGWLCYCIGKLRRYESGDQSLDYLEEAASIGQQTGEELLEALAQIELGLVECLSSRYTRYAPADRFRTGLDRIGQQTARLEQMIQDSDIWLPEAVPHLRDIPNPIWAANTLRGLYILWFAIAGYYQEAIDQGQRYLQQVEESVAERDESQIHNSYYDCHFGMALALTALGKPDESYCLWQVARTGYLRTKHFQLAMGTCTYELRSKLNYRTDQVQERRALAHQAAQNWLLAKGSTSIGGPAAYHNPSLALIEGRWEGTEQLFEAGCDEFFFDQVWLHRERGKDHAAWQLIHEQLPRGAQSRPLDGEFSASASLLLLGAELLMDDGDLASARTWLKTRDHWMDWNDAVAMRSDGHRAWARLHRLASDLDAAREQANIAIETASNPRQPLALLQAHREMGKIELASDQYEIALEQLAVSQSLADACQAPYEGALTDIALAELAARQGGRDDARQLLARAIKTCERLGAQRALDLAAGIEQLNEQQPELRPGGLTPRETDVLQLVSRGLTDAEVAEQLFIGRRTVSSHLTSTYNKLGVNNRAEATRYAIENGIV